MNSTTRQVVTCALLVLYGGITLLDQGLHLLVPTAMHHGLAIRGRATFESCDACQSGLCHVRCSSAAADAARGEQNATLQSSDCASSPHLCPICAYLFQARSGQLQVFTADNWQPLLAFVALTTEHYQSQTDLGPYAPRGPPSCCV